VCSKEARYNCGGTGLGGATTYFNQPFKTRFLAEIYIKIC